MARLLKLKKDSIGLSPDSMVFRGEKKSDFTKIRLIDFDNENLNEIEFKKSLAFL